MDWLPKSNGNCLLIYETSLPWKDSPSSLRLLPIKSLKDFAAFPPCNLWTFAKQTTETVERHYGI